VEERLSISNSEPPHGEEIAHTLGAIDTDPDATGAVHVDLDPIPHRDRSRVPWALLLALMILGGFELWMRLHHWPRKMPYELDLDEYYAVAATIDHHELPDVAIIGSSRAREGIDVPKFRSELSRAVGRRVSVINYGVSGARAYVLESITRRLLRAKHPPRLIIYGGAERDLGYDSTIYDQAAIYWDFDDWRDEWTHRGRSVIDDLPTVIRNGIGRWYFTLRYREQLRLKICHLFEEKKDYFTQLDGSLTLWQRNNPKHSLARHPPTHAAMVAYARTVAEGSYPNRQETQAIERLMQACQSAHVQLLIFQVPIPPISIQYMKPGVEAKYVADMTRLAQQTGAIFLSQDQLDLKLTDRDFRDPSHLNLSGADRVSAALAVQIGQLHVNNTLPIFSASSASPR
jgi:hypothetical protein